MTNFHDVINPITTSKMTPSAQDLETPPIKKSFMTS